MKTKLELVKTAPDVCFKIDAICFSEECYQHLSAAEKIYGEVYAYRDTLDRVIGYIVYGQVWIPDDNNAYISRIGVLPAYRRSGHAARMLHLAEADLRARGDCPSIHADIRADNAASRGLFESAGYSPIWEDDALFDEYKAIRYAKPLGIEEVIS